MEFLWKEKNPKIKNSTFCNDYENDGLKHVIFHGGREVLLRFQNEARIYN